MVLLYKDIEAAVERGCRGRIITSTYQNFTDIESLKSFYTLMGRCPNFQCHLDYESFRDTGYATLGYHSKGYLFEFDDHRELVIGSSNITRYALLKNIEWDVSVADCFEPGVYDEALKEFEEKWEATELLDAELINKYATKLNYAIERWDMDYDFSASKIKPNYMQKKALKELNRYRAVGVNRALTIVSAGSGKIYLAAFDALNFNLVIFIQFTSNPIIVIISATGIVCSCFCNLLKVLRMDETYSFKSVLLNKRANMIAMA